jgi:uncharacterized membrane protein YdjX (TVP38/TMEM64 family)
MEIGLANVAKLTRLVLLVIWAAVIVAAVVFYFSRPDEFTAANIAAFIRSFENEILIVYLAISAVRGFTLLPSTPLVLAGTVLYPDQPWLVLTIAMTGILISSSLIYFCSEALGFSQYFENKKPAAVTRIRRRLEHPYGLAFVALWAFFPLVPTDAVCYAAGTTKMNFIRFITAIFLGELVLCSIYVFTGGAVLHSLMYTR